MRNMDFIVNPKYFGLDKNKVIGMYIQPRFKVIRIIIKIALWYAVWTQNLGKDSNIVAFGYKRHNFISKWLMKKYRDDIVEQGHINDDLAVPMFVYYDWVGKENYIVHHHHEMMDSFDKYRYSSSFYNNGVSDVDALFSTMKVMPTSYNMSVPYLEIKLDNHSKMLAYNLLYFLKNNTHPIIYMGDKNVFETFLQH